jgi:hypothetical protein
MGCQAFFPFAMYSTACSFVWDKDKWYFLSAKLSFFYVMYSTVYSFVWDGDTSFIF